MSMSVVSSRDIDDLRAFEGGLPTNSVVAPLDGSTCPQCDYRGGIGSTNISGTSTPAGSAAIGTIVSARSAGAGASGFHAPAPMISVLIGPGQ